MILYVPKAIAPRQLQDEIESAGIPLADGITVIGDPATELWQANGDELPAGCDAIVNAHVPTSAQPAPDIAGMVTAIQNSPSLDATTKTNLVSALQGK